MTTGSPQLVRQWLLLKKLCVSHTGKTVTDLSSELEVTAKTIRRDLAVFHDAGFPIEESTGPSGRKSYRIASGSRLPELGFTYDEALALYLGRQYLEPLAGTFVWGAAQSAFRKIEATLGPAALKYLDRVANAFHNTTFGVSDYAEHAERIDRLLVGIEDRKVVFITYRSQRSTEPVTYDVHPYSLTRHRGALYLIGFKPEDQAFRTWKVIRIAAAEVDSMPFQRRDDFNAEQFLAGSLGIYHETGDIRVTIRFSSEVARYVQESQWHASQHCERQPDGSLLVRLNLSGTTEVKRSNAGYFRARHFQTLTLCGRQLTIHTFASWTFAMSHQDPDLESRQILQWGRVRLKAESFWVCVATLKENTLQWGRDHSVAERLVCRCYSANAMLPGDTSAM